MLFFFSLWETTQSLLSNSHLRALPSTASWGFVKAVRKSYNRLKKNNNSGSKRFYNGRDPNVNRSRGETTEFSQCTAGGEKRIQDGFRGQIYRLSLNLNGRSTELSGNFWRFVLMAKIEPLSCLSKWLCNEVATCQGSSDSRYCIFQIQYNFSYLEVQYVHITPYIVLDIHRNTFWLQGNSFHLM